MLDPDVIIQLTSLRDMKLMIAALMQNAPETNPGSAYGKL